MITVVLAGYLLLSMLALVMYRRDKAAALRRRRRISERSLHLVSLLGGWPGAWFAQVHFRHKSRKPGFRRMFWISVLGNCLVVGWLLHRLSA